jgi:fucose 4-O-acetylase-like acetyltransferase
MTTLSHSPVREEALSAAHAESQVRIAWLDMTKGFLILLMVLGHVINGLVGAGIVREDGTLPWVVRWMYMFHMPTFFLISGIFIFSSIKRGSGAFVVSKLRTVAYPYVVWSLIQLAIMLIVPQGSTNTRMDLGTAVYSFFLDPVQHFWFLHALFLIFVVFAFLHHFLRITPLGFLGASLLLFVLGEVLSSLGIRGGLMNIISPVLDNMIFVAFGAVLVDVLRERFTALPTQQIVLVGSAGLALVTLLLFPTVNNGWVQTADWVLPLVALPGIVFALAVGVLMERLDARWLRYVGVRTMPIFLAHVIVASGLRIVLVRVFGIEDATIHLLLGFAAGVGVPLLMDWAFERLNFRYAWSFGS